MSRQNNARFNTFWVLVYGHQVTHQSLKLFCFSNICKDINHFLAFLVLDKKGSATFVTTEKWSRAGKKNKWGLFTAVKRSQHSFTMKEN